MVHHNTVEHSRKELHSSKTQQDDNGVQHARKYRRDDYTAICPPQLLPAPAVQP
jgi:hypothetical protein